MDSTQWWAVHEEYRIEHGELVASGAHRKVYDPFAHPELVAAFSKLHDGDEKGLIQFAHTWGLLQSDPWNEPARLRDRAWWVWTHARQIRLVLDLHLYLQTRDLEGLSSFLRSHLPMIDLRGFPEEYADDASVDAEEFTHSSDYADIQDPIESAQAQIADRVNRQLENLHDWVVYNPDTELASLTSWCPDLLTAIYRHLARVVAGERQVARCQECGSLFVVTDRRQRYCPRPPDQKGRGSQCGDTYRKRTKPPSNGG